MTNSYDVDHGLSQCPPGPLEPVELAPQPGAAPATGNTARDQEMYAAGIRTGEENTKHNAAIRAGVPDGWKLVPIEPTIDMIVDGQDTGSVLGPRVRRIYAAMLNAAPAAPGVSTVEDASDIRSRVMEVIAGVWDRATQIDDAADEVIDMLRSAPADGDALDAARWRAYAAQFPEISAAFLAVHAVDGGAPLPTIKGASITGGYVVVTPGGWDADKATKLRDAILRLFPVNPAHTPRPSDEIAAQRKGDARC